LFSFRRIKNIKFKQKLLKKNEIIFSKEQEAELDAKFYKDPGMELTQFVMNLLLKTLRDSLDKK
jgi:hypothetical protein